MNEIAKNIGIIIGVMMIIMGGFRFYKNLVIDYHDQNRKRLFLISLIELILWTTLACLFIYVSFYRNSNHSSELFIRIQDAMFVLLLINMFTSKYMEKYRIKLRKEDN